VRFDGDGVPTGLDHSAFADMDTLLAAARSHHIQLMPVLLDFYLCKSGRLVNGVQLGGRARLVSDPDARRALVDLVLRPIAERYAGDDTIVAWEVMNEPEWCLESVAFAALQDFLGHAIRCVRESAGQPVTIGCASTERLDLVRPLDLDFYQIHWYEHFGSAALERPVADLELGDRVVILGEFPGRSQSIANVLDTAKRAGYAGALVWSMLADDEHSAYPTDLADWVRTATDR
jgi:hypothetical protein